MTDTYITSADAAKVLGVSHRMVNNYAKEGRFKGAFKLGQAWAIPRQAVKELVKVRPVTGFKRGRKKK